MGAEKRPQVALCLGLFCLSSRAGTSLASFIVGEKRRAEKKLKFSGHIVYIYSFDILQEGTKKGGSRKVSAICSAGGFADTFSAKSMPRQAFICPQQARDGNMTAP
ncbi:MAG: hypothetical protein K5981_04755 [Clostridia bacterium]|nr:hypothetical protein [Clostridia bacterium]